MKKDRPQKRTYDDRISTTVKALDAIYGTSRGLRALRKLRTNWPRVYWPNELAAIFCAVLFEPPPLALPPSENLRKSAQSAENNSGGAK